MVSISVIKHRDQSKAWRKEFIWLVFPHPSPSLKKIRTGIYQGRNWEAGTDADLGYRWCLLTCSLDLLSLCFYRTHTTIPWMVPLKMGWALHCQSLIRKMPCSRILWRRFSVEVPYFQITQVCVKVT